MALNENSALAMYLLGTSSAGAIGPLTGTSATRTKGRHHTFQLVLGTGGTPVVKLDFSIDGSSWTEFSELSTANGLFKFFSNTILPYVRARRTDTDAVTANGVRVLMRSGGDSTDLI